MFRSFFRFFQSTPAEGRQVLTQRLSHGGRFTVRYVRYPQHPEVLEFVDCAKSIRYINMDADSDANISQLI